MTSSTLDARRLPLLEQTPENKPQQRTQILFATVRVKFDFQIPFTGYISSLSGDIPLQCSAIWPLVYYPQP